METTELDNGKYKIICDDEHFEALRYDKPWRDLVGDNLILHMFYRILDLEAELKNKDSKIDRLMLDYCPDEMCQEQLDEWASNQKIYEERN